MKFLPVRWLVLAVLLAAGAADLQAEDPAPAGPTFRPVDAEVGLPYPMPDGPRVGLIDYNRDGYVDVLLGRQLWRNDGRNRFQLGVVLSGKYFSFGDIDEDGDLDIYASTHRELGKRLQFQHWLYRCDFEGQYTDVLKESGLPFVDEPKSPNEPYPRLVEAIRAHGFLDYNNDGHLDLFTAGFETIWGKKPYRALPDHLYRGDGTGKFTDVTEAAGLNVEPRPGTGVAFCDFDLDGWMDIYVANYRQKPNYLYHNRGDGTFEEIAANVGADGGEASSAGVACADFDGDGDFDLFVANVSHAPPPKLPEDYRPEPRSMWLRNEFIPSGELKFADVTPGSGLDWQPPPGFKPEAHWIAPVPADFDNDGRLDLFVTENCAGGKNHPEAPLRLGRYDSGYSRLFLQVASGRFIRLDTPRNFLRIEDSYGASSADFNNDGRPDLLVGSGMLRLIPKKGAWFDPQRQRVTLLMNTGWPEADRGTQPARHYLNLTLTARDRPVAGALLEVVLDDETRLRAFSDSSISSFAVRSNQVHFGLGERRARVVRVRLPGADELEFQGNWTDGSWLIDVSRENRRKPKRVEPWR